MRSDVFKDKLSEHEHTACLFSTVLLNGLQKFCVCEPCVIFIFIFA